MLGRVAQAREQLAEEAGLVNFLIGEQAVFFPNTVRVHVHGVEGLAYDVPVFDVLEALRDELVNLEFDAIRAGRR